MLVSDFLEAWMSWLLDASGLLSARDGTRV